MGNFKNILLGIGIVVVFALVLWQGIEVFYPNPKYQDFCNPERMVGPIDNQQKCEEIGGKWIVNDEKIPRPEIPEKEIKGICDRDFFCRQNFSKSEERYSQRVFFISLIVGILAIILGIVILKIEPVGSALIGGGIWAIFWGSVINWRNFSNIWRFLLLLLVLILLIWLAIMFNINNKKKTFFKRFFK